jgi:uncharacterized iron-regulated membrane protein
MRKLIFWIHLGTGSFAGAVILFLSVTGCLLTYQKQIIAWAEHEYYSESLAPGTSTIPLEKLLSLATTGKGKQPVSIVIPADERAPVEMNFGREERLLLDRHTGAILGPGAVRTRSFFTAVTGLHRWFGASPERKPVAHTVKGAFSLALLLMIITGIFLWWPVKWSWTRIRNGALLRFGLTGRARDWNRHNVLGFWTFLPLTIIVLTGLILSYGWATNLLYRITDSQVPVTDGEKREAGRKPKTGSPAQDSLLSIDQLFASARQQTIGEHSLTAIIPQPGDRKMTFLIDFDNGSRPDQKAQLVFDRTTGAVLQLETFSSYSLGKRLRLFVKYIHTGEAGGVLGQTLSGLASLGCCALVWTGIRLFLRRINMLGKSEKKKKKEETERIPVPS